MPLHDSFKKKTGPNIVKLLAAPTVEDLAFAVSQVDRARSEPMAFAWTAGTDDRALYIVKGYGGNDISWILRAGFALDAPVIWRYSTIDCHMIHALITDQGAQSDAPAVIPEFLRPGANDKCASVDVGENQKGDPALADQPEELAPGTLFAGRYEVIEKVGRGGMGTVYKAKQQFIDRFVAVKVLHPQLVADSVSKRRFVQEAKAASTLSHPNLIVVYDFGFGSDGRPFIVMDFVEGKTLQDVVQDVGVLDLETFLAIFAQCCRAISHAHLKGIIHRDLKPGNIVLSREDNDLITVKLVDFGLAKMVAQQDQNLTTSGNVVGSPYYMSPEQCRGEELDPRSDIYALGCVLYFSLTGVVPFAGTDVFQTLYKHIYEKAAPFAVVRPDLSIPQELERIIFKALEIDLDRRYQTVEDLLSDLERLTRRSLTRIPALMLDAFLKPGGMQSSDTSGEEEPVNADCQTGAVNAGPVNAGAVNTGAVNTGAVNTASVNTGSVNTGAVNAGAVNAGAVNAANVSAARLIAQSGIVSTEDFESSEELTASLGGDTAAIMVANGLITPNIFDAAGKCAAHVATSRLSEAHAIILLRYCQRSGVEFERALRDLNWTLQC